MCSYAFLKIFRCFRDILESPFNSSYSLETAAPPNWSMAVPGRCLGPPWIFRTSNLKSNTSRTRKLRGVSPSYISYRKILENLGKVRCWVLGGLVGHFYCEYNRKAAYNFSASFRTSNFSIHYWKTPNPLIFMVLGPGGRDHDSQNQLFSTLETPRVLQNKTTTRQSLNIFLGSLIISKLTL